ncbi:hypothetical protein E2C01_079903 [Portunus trituberculatus]|uniref:Uncharacterized protein n=1 Tax=Portunus trituberculatus TaxID=210409 RepID=A0A5B7IMP7_PORTR|nr:hypothetical protein [Portunus trituberculatus]
METQSKHKAKQWRTFRCAERAGQVREVGRLTLYVQVYRQVYLRAGGHLALIHTCIPEGDRRNIQVPLIAVLGVEDLCVGDRCVTMAFSCLQCEARCVRERL